MARPRCASSSLTAWPSGDLPLPAGLAPELRGGFVEFAIAEPTAVLHALTEWAMGRGEVLAGLVVNRPSLEDVYLELTGGAGHDRDRDGPSPS